MNCEEEKRLRELKKEAEKKFRETFLGSSDTNKKVEPLGIETPKPRIKEVVNKKYFKKRRELEQKYKDAKIEHEIHIKSCLVCTPKGRRND